MCTVECTFVTVDPTLCVRVDTLFVGTGTEAMGSSDALDGSWACGDISHTGAVPITGFVVIPVSELVKPGDFDCIVSAIIFAD